MLADACDEGEDLFSIGEADEDADEDRCEDEGEGEDYATPASLVRQESQNIPQDAKLAKSVRWAVGSAWRRNISTGLVRLVLLVLFDFYVPRQLFVGTTDCRKQRRDKVYVLAEYVWIYNVQWTSL